MVRVILIVVDDVAGSVQQYEGDFDERPAIIAVEEPNHKDLSYEQVKEFFDSEWNYMDGRTLKLYHEDPLHEGHIDYGQAR